MASDKCAEVDEYLDVVVSAVNNTQEADKIIIILRMGWMGGPFVT